MDDELTAAKLKARLFSQRLHAPDDAAKLAMRADAAENEVSLLRGKLAAEQKKNEQLNAQVVRLRMQLSMAQDGERRWAGERARVLHESRATRLALLLRVAKANADRAQIEQQTTALRDWAVEVLSLDPRTVPGYRETFVGEPGGSKPGAPGAKPPAEYDAMFVRDDPELDELKARFDIPAEHQDMFVPKEDQIGPMNFTYGFLDDKEARRVRARDPHDLPKSYASMFAPL